MRTSAALVGFVMIVLIVTSVCTAATTTTTISSSSSAGSSTTLSPEQALAQVFVSSVTLDPESFFPYENGTITVQLTNSGSQSVALVSADLIDNTIIHKNSNSYDTTIYLGPGNTMTYTFLVTAKPPAGTYFPLFTFASRDSGSIRYPIKVDVDPTEPLAIIAKKPDNFALSTKSRVNLSIINPRNGKIDNIIITPQGAGFDLSPANQFISTLAGGDSVETTFEITPHQEGVVTFRISYRNGLNNLHTLDVLLPLNIGENKQAAIPVINNIALTSQGSYYKLDGDVNNAGISDAKALIVTVGPPAKATDPYPEYAIGSLASDDFSSFEVTFTTGDLSSVPVVISWKDADGNTFSTTKILNLGSTPDSGSTGIRTGNAGTTGGTSPGSSSRSAGFQSGGGPPGGGSIFGFGGSRGGGLSAFYPVIAGGIILVVAIVLWKKKKWIAAKFKKK